MPGALSKDLKVDRIEPIGLISGLHHPPSMVGYEESPLVGAIRSILYRPLVDCDAWAHRGAQTDFLEINAF